MTLRECLDRMDAGLIFSVKFALFDEKRPRNRGKLVSYDTVKTIACPPTPKGGGMATIASPPLGVGGLWAILDNKNPKSIKRNAHHREHMTRNICIVLNGKTIGDPIKLHLDLMVRFDGIKVKLP